MPSRPSAITYRPDDEVRRRLEEYAKRTHRNLSQTITHLVLAQLDHELNERAWEVAHDDT